MYQTHWGLDKSPFRGCPDPQSFYESPTHEEALARLDFLVEHHRRLGLLMGPPGSGKSLMLEFFADQLRRQGRSVARLDLLGVGPNEMLFQLAAGLGVNRDPADPVGRLWRAVTDRLAEFRYQQVGSVILLDDVDQASHDVLGQITRLAQHDSSPQARLTIVLAGRTGQMSRIGDRLMDLAELRIDVAAWQPADTADYLTGSLARAGRRAPIFDEPAATKLHELCDGIPRRVAQLAELSLLAGAGEQLEKIDTDVVETVYRELDVVNV